MVIAIRVQKLEWTLAEKGQQDREYQVSIKKVVLKLRSKAGDLAQWL